MGRFFGFLVAATVAFAPSVAFSQPGLPASTNFGDALILRIYGEVSHAGPLLLPAADGGYELLAFRVNLKPSSTVYAPPIHVTAPRLAPIAMAQPRNALPVPLSRSPLAKKTSAFVRRMLVTAEYQPEPASSNTISSSPFTFRSQRPDPLFGFAIANNLLDDSGPTSTGALQLPMMMHVGNLHFQARVGASAGVDAASAETEENLPAYIAPYTSVSRSSLDAALAVPVTPRLLLGVGYDTEHLLGGADVPGLDSLDARNDMYTGRLTFLLPRYSSALSLSAQQYRYQDNFLPTDAYTELRESLDLTIKF